MYPLGGTADVQRAGHEAVPLGDRPGASSQFGAAYPSGTRTSPARKSARPSGDMPHRGTRPPAGYRDGHARSRGLFHPRRTSGFRLTSQREETRRRCCRARSPERHAIVWFTMFLATFYGGACAVTLGTITLTLRKRVARPLAAAMVTAVGGLVTAVTPLAGLSPAAAGVLTAVGASVAAIAPLFALKSSRPPTPAHPDGGQVEVEAVLGRP